MEFEEVEEERWGEEVLGQVDSGEGFVRGSEEGEGEREGESGWVGRGLVVVRRSRWSVGEKERRRRRWNPS